MAVLRGDKSTLSKSREPAELCIRVPRTLGYPTIVTVHHEKTSIYSGVSRSLVITVEEVVERFFGWRRAFSGIPGLQDNVVLVCFCLNLSRRAENPTYTPTTVEFAEI